MTKNPQYDLVTIDDHGIQTFRLRSQSQSYLQRKGEEWLGLKAEVASFLVVLSD